MADRDTDDEEDASPPAETASSSFTTSGAFTDANQSPDIDRGWAFVVAVGSFFIFLLIHGITYSASVFFITFLDEFEQAPSSTAWVINVNSCCTMIFGPLISYLTRWFTKRTLIAFGGLLSTAGLVASAFVGSLEAMFFTFGIATGLGWCLPLVFVFEELAIYFVRLRRIMVTLATTGLAIGQFVYPPLFQALSDEYGWRGGLIILAGINLNFLVIAAIMMEPRRAPQTQDLELLDKTKLLSVEEKEEKEEEEEEKEEGDRRKGSLMDRFRRELAPLQNIFFCLYCVSCLVLGIGIQAFQTHVGNYGRISGCDETQTTFLVSAIGVGSFSGRMSMGPLLHLFRLNVILFFCVAFATAGVVGFLCTFISVYPGLLTLCFIFGYSSASWGLFGEVIIEIVGLELLTPAVGDAFFTCSIGYLFGGPIAAWLYEADPTYRVSFAAAGCMLVTGSTLTLPAYLRSKRKKKSMELEF